MINKIKDAAGFSAMTLGFDVDLAIKNAKRTHAVNRGYPTVTLRLVLVAICIKLWFVTEESIEKFVTQKTQPIHLYDAGHENFAWLRDIF